MMPLFHYAIIACATLIFDYRHAADISAIFFAITLMLFRLGWPLYAYAAITR
jgi:hypothetical protein